MDGRRFDAKGHRQATPDLAVYLHRNARATGGRRLGNEGLRHERLHGTVEGALRQDAGQDIGPHQEAHLLDKDHLQRAARERGVLSHLELPP